MFHWFIDKLKNLSGDFFVLASQAQSEGKSIVFFLYPYVLIDWFRLVMLVTFVMPLCLIWKGYDFREMTEDTSGSGKDTLIIMLVITIFCFLSYIAVVKFIKAWLRRNNSIDGIISEVFLERYHFYGDWVCSITCIDFKTTREKVIVPLKLRPMVYAYKQGSIQETMHNIAIVDYLFDMRTKKIKPYNWLVMWLPIISPAITLLLTLLLFQYSSTAEQVLHKTNAIVFNYPFPFVWMALFWAISSFIYMKMWTLFLEGIAQDIAYNKYENYFDGFPRRAALYNFFNDDKILDLLMKANKKAEIFMEKMIGIGLVNFLVILQISINNN